MNIIEKIRGIPNLNWSQGCTDKEIREAEVMLGLEFPREYKEYAREYGTISFYNTEWTGLGVSTHLNVVQATRIERDANRYFPQGYFVIENIGFGNIIIANAKGEVSMINGKEIEPVSNSISAYLDICIARNVNK